MAKKPRIFYGWFIVGEAVIFMSLAYSTRASFAVFFPPILDEFGWSRASTAFMFSLNLLFYGIFAPLTGNLLDRWNTRRVTQIGTVMICLAIALCAFSNQLWQFYVLYGFFVSVGMACIGWPLISPMMANWFSRRRGLVMGIGQLGAGLSFSFGIVAEYFISRLGWRNAYLAMAVILAVVLLPLFSFLLYYRPSLKGLKPYGEGESKAPAGDPMVLSDRGWTLKQALRSPRLWLLVTTQMLFWGAGCYMVLAHQVKFAEDAGYSSTFAASIFALYGIFMAIGQGAGVVADWFSCEKTHTLASILTIAALVALLNVSDTSRTWLLYAYAVCFGLGAGIQGPAMFSGAANIFYGKSYGAINGMILSGMGIGGALGSWLAGYIYDITGKYTAAFIIGIGFFAVSTVTFWFAAPRKGSLQKAEVVRRA